MADAKRTDPELLRQLDEAKGSGAAVSAVVKIKRRRGAPPDSAAVEARLQDAVDRTCEATGEAPDDMHVMARVGVAYVNGSERFVRSLVGQPEIDGATANEATTAEA
ncbi:MAG TPA: hypothetical protein VM264_12385 [Acidimicrobiales bacterium]|nr:hypothetical protein [Acidimicrobiales bacterium]